MQSGRATNGTLWISDQPLPTGVKAAPLELDPLMTLPPDPRTVTSSSQPPKTVDTRPATAEKLTPAEQATCRGINKRYNESKTTLENTERDKASGLLLIPDSGLVTMRQNLATLARMRSLCP